MLEIVQAKDFKKYSKLIVELSTNKVVAAAVAANPALKSVLGKATRLINSSNNLRQITPSPVAEPSAESYR